MHAIGPKKTWSLFLLFCQSYSIEREREREKNTKESQPQPLVNILHFYIMQIFCHLCTNQYQNWNGHWAVCHMSHLWLRDKRLLSIKIFQTISERGYTSHTTWSNIDRTWCIGQTTIMLSSRLIYKYGLICKCN